MKRIVSIVLWTGCFGFLSLVATELSAFALMPENQPKSVSVVHRVTFLLLLLGIPLAGLILGLILGLRGVLPGTHKFSPESAARPPKASVPVGLGTFLGVLMLIAGVALTFFPDSGDDARWESLLGKGLLVCGATLAFGGVYVFVAERKPRHPAEAVHPEGVRTPKWAYIFAGACLLVAILGGFIGALCGLTGSGMCIAFSRNRAFSVQRRIYACILTVGFSWMAYFAWASQVLSALNSAHH
jgi:hypothetical protein